MKAFLRIFLPIMLCLTLCLSLRAAVFAENEIDSGDWYGLNWTLDENYVLTISGNGAMASIGHGSTEAWRQYKTEITSVIIENGVTSICDYAFMDCSKITNVTIPDSVASIGISAFRGCSNIAKIVIPDSVTIINGYTFYGCSNLYDVTLPDSITSINSYAFTRCNSLTAIDIPDNVTSILTGAFQLCSNLTDITIPDGVTSIGFSAFESCSSLKSIIIPKGVTYIDTNTFKNCSSLTDVTFNGKITGIDNYAFSECSKLTYITIPDSLTSIGDYAFYNCSELTNITIPDGVTSIGEYAFYNCGSLLGIHMPDGITAIKKNTFWGCSNLANIIIPNSVKSIGDSAFCRCHSLTDITIPGSVINIDDDAFYWCENLKIVTIQHGTSSIGESAFNNCYNLTDISIPNSVTIIGERAFYACLELTDVYYGGTQDQWNKIAIGSYNTELTSATIHWATSPITLTAAGGDTHEPGSTKDLGFVCSDVINDVYVDGSQLTNPADFSISADGKTLTLYEVYLNTLLPGTYKINVYSATGAQASTFFTIKAAPTLTATGSNAHTRYDPNDLSFLCSDSIITVIIDGEKLTANFSLSPDGKTVTLSAAYLDTLASGEHTISVYTSAQGQASANFSIVAGITLTATGSNTYTLYSMNDLNFECNEVIENAYVGGQLLDSAYCGISPDGKTITLYAALLNQLRADNSYTLKVYNSAGDSADATFRIEDCPLLVPGVPMAADSKQPLRFIAPNDGYYNFYFLNADNTRYEFQYLDAQKGTWRNTPSMRGRKYVKNEVIYLRPMYNQTTEGKLDVLVREITPPTQNSIEVGDAYNVTNSSMTLDFTLNVTGNSADNGYSIGLMVSWEDSPNFGPGANTSRYSYQGAYAVRNNETWTLTIGSFVPEQSFYYKAILLQNGNTLAQGSTIHSVQFNSDLTGFEQLTLNTPYTMTNLGEAHFYFEAPTDGVYAVEADGISSINVKDNGGYPVRGTSGQSDFLCGTPIKAGERIYIGSAQNTGQSGSVAVYEGQKKLPEVTVGTQSVEQPNGIRTIPMYFIAPEDGEYSFTTNSAAYMRIMDETGNFLYRRGIYYRTSLLKDQVIWIDGMERASGDTLTIVHETIPLRKLTFPAELTHLDDEACIGLNIDDVVFGDKIQSIGNKAFADCPNLRRVEIPVADVDIADNAFDNSPNVILYAPIGGSVEQFAAKHRIMLEAMIP